MVVKEVGKMVTEPLLKVAMLVEARLVLHFLVVIHLALVEVEEEVEQLVLV